MQATKIFDEMARVPAGVADTVAGVADTMSVIADKVDLRQVADQMVDRVTTSRDQIQRKASGQMAGPAALVGVLLVLAVVLIRMRGRDQEDSEDRAS